MASNPGYPTPEALESAEQDRRRRIAAYDAYIPDRDSFMAWVVVDALNWHTHVLNQHPDPETKAVHTEMLDKLSDIYVKMIKE